MAVRVNAAVTHSWSDLTAVWKKHHLMIIMTALFFIGMLYGSLMIGFSENEMIESLGFLTKGYITGRTEQSLLTTFLNSLFSIEMFIIALFLLGFSAVSAPLIVFLPIFKGLGLGVSTGYLYITYGVKGVAFCAAMILLPALFSSLAVILAGRESLKLSILFLSAFVPRIQGALSARTIKLYSAKFIVLAAIGVVSAISDCLVTFLFSGFLIL